MERRGRLRRGAAGERRGGADAQVAVLPFVLAQIASRGDRAGRAAGAHGAGRDVESPFHVIGLGGQRFRDQDDLVLQQRARPSAEEEDHRSPARLSRRDHRLGQPDRPAGLPARLRPAVADDAPCLLSALLAFWRAGRKRRGFCEPAGGRTRGRDHRGGAGDCRRIFRRAGDGGGRRHSAAAHLLGENPGGVPASRRSHRRRRGDHRIWPHRTDVRLANLRHSRRTFWWCRRR